MKYILADAIERVVVGCPTCGKTRYVMIRDCMKRTFSGQFSFLNILFKYLLPDLLHLLMMLHSSLL